jgi:hypothetical protein
MSITSEILANRSCKAVSAGIAADFVMVPVTIEVQPFDGIGL